MPEESRRVGEAALWRYAPYEDYLTSRTVTRCRMA